MPSDSKQSSGLLGRLREALTPNLVAGDPDFPAAMHPAEFSQLVAVYAATAPKTVVEWGSGGSTIAIPAKFSCIEHYVSIEHNEAWYERVSKKSEDPRVVTLHRPPISSDPEPAMFEQGKGKTRAEYVEWSDRCEVDRSILADYVDAPFEQHEQFDLAFVDGRARVFCIERAWAALRSGGVLVVHDSQRETYKAALRKLDGAHTHWLDPWERGQVCVTHKP